MSASTLPHSLLACLGQFRHCFSEPVHARFVVLLTGWILCTGKHTITGLVRAAGVFGHDEHSAYRRFFSRARRSTDSVGLVVARLILERLNENKCVTLSLDDTLARHTGKHIANAAMHRDPLLSTWKTPYFHFGHVWVVLAIVVHIERWNNSYSLPILARLYRSKKLNE